MRHPSRSTSAFSARTASGTTSTGRAYSHSRKRTQVGDRRLPREPELGREQIEQLVRQRVVARVLLLGETVEVRVRRGCWVSSNMPCSRPGYRGDDRCRQHGGDVRGGRCSGEEAEEKGFLGFWLFTGCLGEGREHGGEGAAP